LLRRETHRSMVVRLKPEGLPAVDDSAAIP